MLSPKPPFDANHPLVRVPPALANRFHALCRKSKVSYSEGIRQLVARYLENPFKFQPPGYAQSKTAHLPHAIDSKRNVLDLARHAKRSDITHSEAIRQIVQQHLENER